MNHPSFIQYCLHAAYYCRWVVKQHSSIHLLYCQQRWALVQCLYLFLNSFIPDTGGRDSLNFFYPSFGHFYLLFLFSEQGCHHLPKSKCFSKSELPWHPCQSYIYSLKPKVQHERKCTVLVYNPLGKVHFWQCFFLLLFSTRFFLTINWYHCLLGCWFQFLVAFIQFLLWMACIMQC